MDSRKMVLVETGIVAIGEVICSAAMIGVFALLGYYDTAVLFGGILGGLMAVLNFFFMAVGVNLAADKAADQNVKGGKALLQGSMLLRYLVLFVVLFAGAKSGLCNPIASVIPLVFVRPVLALREFFRKPGDKQK